MSGLSEHERKAVVAAMMPNDGDAITLAQTMSTLAAVAAIVAAGRDRAVAEALAPVLRSAIQRQHSSSEWSPTKTTPVVVDLDDPYYHGQSLPEALAEFSHVHSATGVCVKNAHGPFCTSGDPLLCPGDGCEGCRHCQSDDGTVSSDIPRPDALRAALPAEPEGTA